MMSSESRSGHGSTASQKASTSEKTIDSPDTSQVQVFTIGKVDAGIAVLISDSVHLIEFPSLLLPAGVGPGSIVNISCTRNVAAERATTAAFWDLQHDICSQFGEKEPQAPQLRVRNTTQTSVTLEWDKLELAQAKLLGLSIWRNGQRLTTIPNPLTNTSTKLSGLSLDSDYTFHLQLKTSAGTYNSPTVKIHTHTISDTSGISVCFGLVEPVALLGEAKTALGMMKARYSDKIQIETTHFVATSPASPSNPNGGPCVEYQKALQLSIPVVSPEWVLACAREQKMVPIANYYSIGTTNHAASISSAQLVGPNGQLPPSKQLPRRATIEEEPLEAPDVTQAPLPELAEEEPDAPPVEEVVVHESPFVGQDEVEEPSREEVAHEEPPVVEEEVEEPFVEESLVEEPFLEESLVEEPFVEESLVEEPLVEESLAEEPPSIKVTEPVEVEGPPSIEITAPVLEEVEVEVEGPPSIEITEPAAEEVEVEGPLTIQVTSPVVEPEELPAVEVEELKVERDEDEGDAAKVEEEDEDSTEKEEKPAAKKGKKGKKAKKGKSISKMVEVGL